MEEAFAKFDASGDNQLDYKVIHSNIFIIIIIIIIIVIIIIIIIIIVINITVITLSGILPDDPQETGGKVKKELKTMMIIFIKSYF